MILLLATSHSWQGEFQLKTPLDILSDKDHLIDLLRIQLSVSRFISGKEAEPLIGILCRRAGFFSSNREYLSSAVSIRILCDTSSRVLYPEPVQDLFLIINKE